jgi:Fibronectin type III domain
MGGVGGLMDGVVAKIDTRALATLACLLILSVPVLGQTSALPWAGQATCQLNLQQDGYAHQETQTWTITGTAPRADSNQPVYDATWSFSGAGSTQKLRGAQTVAAAWNRGGGPVATAIAISLRPAGQLVIRSWRSQLHSLGATTGLQKVIGAGQTEIRSDVYEWPFPAIEAAGNSADVSGTGTIVVNGGLLPMQAPSANFTAACAWHFARGAAAVASPAAEGPAANSSAANVGASSSGALAAAGVQAAGTAIKVQSSGSGMGAPGSGTVAAASSNSGSISSGPISPASSASGTTSPGSPAPGSTLSASTSSASGALCSSAARAGAPAAVNPPTVVIGPGTVTLSWTAPTGGAAIDAYEVESQPGGGGTATQQTVKAPGTGIKLTLTACAYPAGNCSAAGGYTFRVRAHNGAGCGPYSSATSSVRPLVSYVGDNVAGIWSAGKCLQCHTESKVSLDLSGSATESYNRVGLYSARVPGNRDRLLACPTGGLCVTANGTAAHPVGFSATSVEYFLLLAWIRDGLRN